MIDVDAAAKANYGAFRTMLGATRDLQAARERHALDALLPGEYEAAQRACATTIAEAEVALATMKDACNQPA